MNLLQWFILTVISTTQPPKMSMHEFLRDIDPPRIGQQIEIRLKDMNEPTILGILRNKTKKAYELETQAHPMRFIYILDIDTIA